MDLIHIQPRSPLCYRVHMRYLLSFSGVAQKNVLWFGTWAHNLLFWSSFLATCQPLIFQNESWALSHALLPCSPHATVLRLASCCWFYLEDPVCGLSTVCRGWLWVLALPLAVWTWATSQHFSYILDLTAGMIEHCVLSCTCSAVREWQLGAASVRQRPLLLLSLGLCHDVEALCSQASLHVDWINHVISVSPGREYCYNTVSGVSEQPLCYTWTLQHSQER